ncbi:hypothetical protein LSTR_LSTR007836 [Laodelphax striatellus]|uniref:Transposase Helix-turn-helix domain-containing protein n=1 Tax=Laodelphax striatellus TaxID=195883 RepID=A0A482WMP6_LAOST|nr:hypothetical protein LSTR_LSTR007836 [Laodelphax striatellus]
MKTKITAKEAAECSLKKQPVIEADDVNVLEFGELIDDICSDYVEEELFISDDVIDSIFCDQNNQMFMNNDNTNNDNQGNSESLLEDLYVGEEVSVATINTGEELSTTEIDNINNLYEQICNENQQQAGNNVPELFNLPIDKPEELNAQQDISYVNHIDTELGQNIWYGDNLENIVPNIDCDILPFGEVELNYSDPQQVNGLDSNKSAKCLQNLIDHTVSADLNDNQDHFSLYDSLCESFDTTENNLPSDQTSNCSSIFSDQTIVQHSPSTFQNINDSSTDQSTLQLNHHRARTKTKTSKFQGVMKIQNVYMKYCVVDSPSKLNKLRIVNKPDKMGNLITKLLNTPQTSKKDKVKSSGLSAKGILDRMNNAKLNPVIVPKKQLFVEVDKTEKVRKFEFSVDSSTPLIFSCMERSARIGTELRKVNFINNNEKINYYTGIPGYPYYVALLNCLNLPSIAIATPFEMLLLTLVKIKLNLDWTDLAYRFGENVECVKNIFGYTVSILVKCLPKLVQWLPELIHCGRGSLIYYIFKIDLLPKNPSDSLVERIYICFSNSSHPVLFVSNPTTEQFSTSAELLEKSGIRQGLEHGDIVVFDNTVSLQLNDILYSLDLSKQTTNLIPLDKRIFQLETYQGGQFQLVQKSIVTNKKLLSQVLNVQKRVSQMFKFSFLKDSISCEWLNNTRNHELFCDVLRIVCGLMNLCNTLPFSLNNVKILMDERKNINIVPT